MIVPRTRVFEGCANWAKDRNLQAANDKVRKPVAPAETVAKPRLIIVGIESEDHTNAIGNLGHRRQRKHGADRFASETFNSVGSQPEIVSIVLFLSF
jgi:hypothetical protein